MKKKIELSKDSGINHDIDTAMILSIVSLTISAVAVVLAIMVLVAR